VASHLTHLIYCYVNNGQLHPKEFKICQERFVWSIVCNNRIYIYIYCITLIPANAHKYIEVSLYSHVLWVQTNFDIFLCAFVGATVVQKLRRFVLQFIGEPTIFILPCSWRKVPLDFTLFELCRVWETVSSTHVCSASIPTPLGFRGYIQACNILPTFNCMFICNMRVSCNKM
jgi:hypothetical protein